MASDSSDTEIRRLVLVTEDNFKRIERYNGDFVSVALNEWRYATRHVVDMLCHHDEGENRTKAVSHLRRANYDSYDILIDCILARFDELHDEYRDYASIAKAYINDYPAKIAVMRKAKSIHSLPVEKRKDRDSLYAEIASVCDEAESFVNELEETADDWRTEIRKLRRKDRIMIVGVAAGVFAAIPTIIWILKCIVSALPR